MATNSLTLLSSRDKVCVPFLWMWAGICMTALTKRVQGSDVCDFQSWITKGHADSTLFSGTLAGPSSCQAGEASWWHSDPQSQLSRGVQPSSQLPGMWVEDLGSYRWAHLPAEYPQATSVDTTGYQPFSKSWYTKLWNIRRRAIVLNSKFQDGLLHRNK